MTTNQRSPYSLPLNDKIELLNRWRSKDKLSEYDKECVWYILTTAANKTVCKQFGYRAGNPKLRCLVDVSVDILASLLLDRFKDKGVSYSFFVFRVAFSTLLAEYQLNSNGFNYPVNVSRIQVLKRFVWYTKKCRNLGWNYANPNLDLLTKLHLTETYKDAKYRKKVEDEVTENFKDFREFYSVLSTVSLNVFKT